MIRLWFPTVLGFLLGVLPAQAHEMWLEPRGNDLSRLSGRFDCWSELPRRCWRLDSTLRGESRMDLGQDVQVIESRYGDVPGIRLSNVKAGDTLIYQSIPEVLRYSDAEKFRAFGEERAANLLARHAQRGFSTHHRSL